MGVVARGISLTKKGGGVFFCFSGLHVRARTGVMEMAFFFLFLFFRVSLVPPKKFFFEKNKERKGFIIGRLYLGVTGRLV